MRYLDKFLKWLGFGMLLAPVLWYLACQFDEAVDPEVQAVLSASVQEPAEPNGYYALVGMHAPTEVDDIHAYGHDLITQYRQAVTADPAMDDEYRFPERSLDFRGDKALLCAPRKAACLPNAARTAGALDNVFADNRLLIARYRSLYRYPRFVETMPMHRSAPLVNFPSTAHELVLATIARDAAHGHVAPAIEALAVDTRYWRTVLADTRMLLTKAVAVSYLVGNYHLLAEMIAAVPLSPAEMEIVQALLVSLSPAERSMTEPMRWEFAVYGDYADMIKRSIREGLQGEDNSKNTPMRAALAWLAEPLVQRNATRNMVYRHHMAVAAVAVAPTIEFDARRNALAAEHASKFHWHYLYNPLGKFMFHIGEPLWLPYVARVHDLDGYIQLVRLQLALKQAKVASSDVPTFLETSDASIRDPYTGLPMEWDPVKKTLSFRARGARPKESPVLTVRLSD